MKRIIFTSTLVATLLSCKKEEAPEENDPIVDVEKIEIPFEGKWKRTFEAGPGNTQTVVYSIYQDSIRYTLTGPVANSNYNMIRDTFLLEDNRYIGHTTDNVYYLIFAKNVVDDSISLYKEIIPNFSAGMSTDVPHDSTTQNHGWAVYYKD
ncbi:MAG: hypothetical protein N4A35_14995 [Flavobacteriales bacterium]|jgi:hypothetical protein|nr:hypothetical protein [Flavobacteriales bacterium]